ncbi:MAG: HAMP domain-containing sensor histidine kinase [Nakamurella sp.]
MTLSLFVVIALFIAAIFRLLRLVKHRTRALLWHRTLAERRATQLTYVSHEIRTPLALINASANLLIERLSDSIQYKELQLLKVIQNNTNHVTTIVEQTLTMARAEASLITPKFEFCNIQRLVTDTATELRRVSSIPIVTDTHYAPGLVYIDKYLFRQALINLINNAAQPTRHATSVWIRLFQSDEGLKISISDDGDGMTQKQRETSFEFYQSDHGQSHNVGAGLAISRMIVNLHHGKIFVDTTIASGTTIIVYIPKLG